MLTHLERVSNLYNKRHASHFARQTSEKKYLAPWGLSLTKAPSSDFGNSTKPLSTKEKFDLFSALHFIKYRMKKARQQKQRDRYYQIYLAIRNRIVAGNWALVPSCVKRHISRTPPGLDVDHFFEQGYFALISACDCFDPWFGASLATYACNAIIKSFYHRKKTIYLHSIDKSVDAIAPSSDETKEWMVEQLTQILDSDFLTDREKTVISMRFGCYGHNDWATLKEVGDELGVSKERARQIQQKTITKLKIHLNLQIDRF